MSAEVVEHVTAGPLFALCDGEILLLAILMEIATSFMDEPAILHRYRHDTELLRSAFRQSLQADCCTIPVHGFLSGKERVAFSYRDLFSDLYGLEVRLQVSSLLRTEGELIWRSPAPLEGIRRKGSDASSWKIFIFISHRLP